MKKGIKIIFLVLIIAGILSISVGASDLRINNPLNIAEAGSEEKPLNKTELHFLDVGQGDSTLVILPDGKTMLIDAGTSQYGPAVVNYLKNLNISKIDYLVMTHPDADHIGGMSNVIDNFDIDNIYMTDKTTTTKTFEDLLLKIESKGLSFTTPKTNDIITESNDIKAMILSPSNKQDNNNDMSIVIEITYKNNTFLLMGDAGSKVENNILNSFSNIKADLIKIGHHGSSYSSLERFIQEVSPKFAIISVGENNQYGHPSEKTIETLKKYGVEIYRTDELGNIIAISDGNVIKINSKKMKLG